MKKVIIGVIVAVVCVACIGVGGAVAYASVSNSNNANAIPTTPVESSADQAIVQNNPNALTTGETITYSTQNQFSYNETQLYNAIQTAADKVTQQGDFITCNLAQYFDYQGIRYYKIYDYFENWTGQLADSNNNYSGLRTTFYVSTTGKMLKAIPNSATVFNNSTKLPNTGKENELLKNAAQYIIGNAPLEPNNAYVNYNLSANLNDSKVVDGQTCYLVTITPKVNEQDGTITGSTQNYNTTNIPKIAGTNNEQIYVSLSGYVYIPNHK